MIPRFRTGVKATPAQKKKKQLKFWQGTIHQWVLLDGSVDNLLVLGELGHLLQFMGHLHEEQGFNCREVHLVVLLQCSLEEDTLLLPAGSQQCLQATQELPDLQFLQALFLKGIRSPDLGVKN